MMKPEPAASVRGGVDLPPRIGAGVPTVSPDASVTVIPTTLGATIFTSGARECGAPWNRLNCADAAAGTAHNKPSARIRHPITCSNLFAPGLPPCQHRATRASRTANCCV